MKKRRSTYFLLLLVILFGCSAPPTQGMPVAMSVPGGSIAQPTYVVAPADATPTATPFQPIPPTPAFLPGENPVTPFPEPSATATPPEVSPEETTVEEAPLEQPFGQVNILLLGSDKRPYGGGFRTDTIILVTLNSELGSVNVTSFPRDLYVTIPGWGSDRINTAWTRGQFKMLANTMEHNFGVRPDYYALVHFSSFKKIIDDIGGLDVRVGQSVSDYRAGYYVTVPAGKVHMDADDVLWYVRTRKTTSDLARNRRQQEVIQAIFEKMLSMNALRQVPELYERYKGSITTNIGLMDLLTWLPLAAKVAETGNLNQYFISSKQVYNWITPYGAMVLVPVKPEVMKVIRKSQNIK